MAFSLSNTQLRLSYHKIMQIEVSTVPRLGIIVNMFAIDVIPFFRAITPFTHWSVVTVVL